MTRWPEPTLAPWKPGAAAAVRGALASLYGLTADRVRLGAYVPERGLAELTVAPLRRLGLDRAAEVACDVRMLGSAPVPQRVRALARALLLPRLAQHFPDGPAPRAALEPLLRAQRPQHEQVLVRGRVLSPLTVTGDGALAWDVGAERLVRLSDPALARDHVVLARRAWLDLERHTRVLRVGRSVEGVRAERCDRRMLRHAAGSFERVGFALARELGDPFTHETAHRLIGPFRYVRSLAKESGAGAVVEDAAGLRATLVYPPLSLQQAAGRDPIWTLAQPVAQRGRLTLVPALVWLRGRRVPARPMPARGSPWEDGVVADLADHLSSMVELGVEASHTHRSRVRALLPHVDAEGFSALAQLAADAVAPDRATDPLAFALAAHMAHAVLSGPRWVQLGEAA